MSSDPLDVVPAGHHRLHGKWAFWAQKKSKRSAGASWLEGITCLGRFNTVEGFWGMYSHILKPESISGSLDLMLFRDGIKPMWEDESNARGGRFTFKMKKGTACNAAWEETLLALIGEQLDTCLEFCGAILSIRYHDDSLSLWNKNADDEGTLARQRDSIVRALHMPSWVEPEYSRHKKGGHGGGHERDPYARSEAQAHHAQGHQHHEGSGSGSGPLVVSTATTPHYHHGGSAPHHTSGGGGHEGDMSGMTSLRASAAAAINETGGGRGKGGGDTSKSAGWTSGWKESASPLRAPPSTASSTGAVAGSGPDGFATPSSASKLGAWGKPAPQVAPTPTSSGGVGGPSQSGATPLGGSSSSWASRAATATASATTATSTHSNIKKGTPGSALLGGNKRSSGSGKTSDASGGPDDTSGGGGSMSAPYLGGGPVEGEEAEGWQTVPLRR